MSQNTPKKPQGLARLNRLIDLNTYPIQPVLRILLKDHSTGENIIWATDNYSHLGNTYHSAATMRLKDLVKLDKSIIQPRVYKTLELQKQRTKVNAEVFTPSWICCLMNNHLDDIWFGRKDVFNKMKDKSWRATNKPIEFPASGSKTWQGYVDSRRIEITCGEAPYLVSRYDTTTGKVLDITHRIGILDRKLRVINENAKDEAEWIKWALRAYQSTYGYEYQGDSLLIARINLLMTFCDYMQARWDRNPTEDELKAVAFVISWNIWQMNGLTYKTSYDADADRKRLQEIIDKCDAEISTYTMCANLPDENYSPTQCDLQLSKEYTLQELIDFVKEEDEISLAYMYAEVHGLKIVEEDKRDFDAEIKQARMQLEEAINEIRLIRDETYAEKCMIIDAPYCLIRNWRMRRTEYFRDIAQKNKGKGIMKFDFCIGNPPYQETKGGTKNIDIWPSFVKESTNIATDACLIHPGRWVIPKKQMQTTQSMIIEAGLKNFDYYPNASDLFGGVDIRGGITITSLERGYNKEVKYFNNGAYYGNYNKDELFISDDFEREIYTKLALPFANKKTMASRIIGNVGSLGGSEFGYKKHGQVQLLSEDKSSMSSPVAIWANTGFGSGARFAWYYIEESELKNVPENLFASRKVMIDKKGHSIDSASCGNIIGNIPQIVSAKSTASGDVFFCFPEVDDDYHLTLIKSMFLTKTIRFLMSIKTKDQYVRGFELVPDYILFLPMLNGQLFTDKWFYNTFNFSQELIDYIESHISAKNDLLCEVKETE